VAPVFIRRSTYELNRPPPCRESPRTQAVRETAERTEDGLGLRLDEKAGAVPAATLARELKALGLTPEVAGALAQRLESAPPGDCFWAGARQVVHFGSGNDFSGSNIAAVNHAGRDFTQTNTGRLSSDAKPPA